MPDPPASLLGHYVSAGPPASRRTRRQKIAKEWGLLRRDGLRKYVRVLRALRRFHKSLARLEVDDA